MDEFYIIAFYSRFLFHTYIRLYIPIYDNAQEAYLYPITANIISVTSETFFKIDMHGSTSTRMPCDTAIADNELVECHV